MSSHRTVVIEKIPLVPPAGDSEGAFGPKAHFLEVMVSYDKGGMNYFNYKTDPRGFSVSVKPIWESGGSTGFTIMEGRRLFLLPAARYSDKALAQAVALARTDPRLADVKVRVLVENGRRLADRVPA